MCHESPSWKSEKRRRIFFSMLCTDGSELHTSMRYLWHGSAELELNPPFQNPGSATAVSALINAINVAIALFFSNNNRNVLLKGIFGAYNMDDIQPCFHAIGQTAWQLPWFWGFNDMADASWNQAATKCMW